MGRFAEEGALVTKWDHDKKCDYGDIKHDNASAWWIVMVCMAKGT